MNSFTSLFRQLDQTTSTLKKVDAMAGFFENASDRDILWTIALLSKKRPKRVINTTQLREWAAEKADIPLWLFEASYHVVGDLAETISLVFEDKKDANDLELTYWIESLIKMRNESEEDKKSFVFNAWETLNKDSRLLFNKLITGGLRVGVSRKLMTRALSQWSGIEEPALAHRLMGNWKPQDENLHNLLFSEDAKDKLSRPYPFALAYPIDDKAEDLGTIEEWAAEYKWDGIRVQLISRDGSLFLWSRGEELINDGFPELDILSDELPYDCVIDGELVAYKENAPMPFGRLQRRLGRKTVPKKLREQVPVYILAYDIMEFRGEDLRKSEFAYRRKILKKAIPQHSDHIGISEILDYNSWKDLKNIRSKAREEKSEGLMLKKRSGPYHQGRKKGNWWKWKVDPLSIDAVMLYIQSGHGRRANLFTDLTLAVWKGDQLIPIAKAYSGLTDREFKKLTQWTRKNTKETFGPVRSVVPHHVFEIGFEGIRKSNRHKSGIALRFPRILRWRHDKPAEEADTLENVEHLLELYG